MDRQPPMLSPAQPASDEAGIAPERLNEQVIDAAFEKADLEKLIWHFQPDASSWVVIKIWKSRTFGQACRTLQRRAFHDTVKECLSQLEQELSKPEGVEN